MATSLQIPSQVPTASGRHEQAQAGAIQGGLAALSTVSGGPIPVAVVGSTQTNGKGVDQAVPSGGTVQSVQTQGQASQHIQAQGQAAPSSHAQGQAAPPGHAQGQAAPPGHAHNHALIAPAGASAPGPLALAQLTQIHGTVQRGSAAALGAIKIDFVALRNRLQKMYSRSYGTEKMNPWVPRSFDEYFWHLLEVSEHEARKEERKRNLTKLCATLGFPLGKMKPPLRGKRFGTNYVEKHQPFHDQDGVCGFWNCDDSSRGVMGMQTIWKNDHQRRKFPRAVAPWPTPKEFAWEGDLRVATEDGRYRRCMPLPQEPSTFPGYESEGHGPRMMLQYQFDLVGRVPTFDSVYNGVDEILEEDIPLLLDSDILEAISEFD